MRILVVNSNTSQFVTDAVAAEARASASAGTEIVPVTGSFGARIIGTRSENTIAAHSTMVLVAEHHRGCDAVLIAVSYDTGLAGARELLPIPVVGMTEAALLTACMLGGRTGIITFGRRGLPLYQELVASYGLADRVAGWRTIESPAPYRPGGRDEVRAEIIQRAGRLIEEDGAETVILSGAVMAGMAGALRNDIAVPVLDGISCGVLQAELLVRLGTRKPIAGSYALPGLRDLVGVAPSLGQAFAERR